MKQSDPPEREPFQVVAERMAVGGAAVGRASDGRVVFITGGVPGDELLVRPTKIKKRHMEASIVEVLKPGPKRRTPPCVHVAEGCGGCDWQQIEDAEQSRLRREVVATALERIGGISEVDIRTGPRLAPVGYRATARLGVTDGKAGFRQAGAHQLVEIDSCLVAHPLVDEIIAEGRFPGANEVVISAGVRTGERMVVVSPTAEGVEVPDDVVVVGSNDIRAGHIHEKIEGKLFRFSAGSFSQPSPEGAEALVAAARQAIEVHEGPMLDAYCGVGLFGALLAGDRRLFAVESASSSVSDAQINLPSSAELFQERVESWASRPVATVIADPPRKGLGDAGVRALMATEPRELILVSCDPGSLGRDARLLGEAGMALDYVTVIDLFSQTSHVETVSRFVPVKS